MQGKILIVPNQMIQSARFTILILYLKFIKRTSNGTKPVGC